MYKCIVDRKYSGLNENFEVIQVSPDKETLKQDFIQQRTSLKQKRVHTDSRS
jgi:hypothetical protein